jgi:polysaccharide biosynthesis protein PslH
MNFLQITPKPPLPLTDGGCIAYHALTKGLLNAGHNVKVLTIFTEKHDFMPEQMSEDYIRSTDIEGVFVDTKLNVIDIYSSFVTRDAYNLNRFYSVDVDIRLTRILQKQKFDCIILEGLFTTPYLATIRRNSDARVVLRSHNIEHHIWDKLAHNEKNFFKRIFLNYLSKKLHSAEIEAWRSVDGIACISQSDLITTKAFVRNRPLYMLPISTHIHVPKRQNDEAIKMYHIGSMDWMPNIEAMEWFNDTIWPALHQRFPALQMHIAGRKMPDTFVTSEKNQFFVHGEVADAKLFALNYDIMAVPLLSGSGIRVKILEAFALGIPVIATHQALRGLEIEHGVHAMIANTPEEWASAYEHLQSAEVRRKMVEEAQVFLNQNFGEQSITRPFIDFIKSLKKK